VTPRRDFPLIHVRVDASLLFLLQSPLYVFWEFMAKSARVTSTNHGRPITSFFAPANRGGRPPNSSPDAPLSHVSSQPQGGAQGIQQSSKSKSTNGLSTTKVTSGSKDSEAQQTPTRRSERRANQQTSFLSPGASIPSLKRVRTPDAQLRSPSKTGNPKTRTRRTNKFDTDSDSDANNLSRVVYVKSVRDIPADFHIFFID
jgi:hypothetical protein